MFDSHTVRALYKKLLTLYPRGFAEQFGEQLLQTFSDLYNAQQRRTGGGLLGFVIWMFAETAIGILREHFMLIAPGGIMQTLGKTIGSPALLGLLLIVPFALMEIVNRRDLNEEFPYALFFALWLNVFAVSVILLPIASSRWTGNRDRSNPTLAQGSTLLTNARSSAIVSALLIFATVTLAYLAFIGWAPLERLINGANPEEFYAPGRFIAIALISIPIAAGFIAGRPIVSTLRAGGSLFAHPLHLFIVVVISLLFAAGVVSLIADQWSCFMGVPGCD